MNAVLLIAHAPLASALRCAALHVLGDAAVAVRALDVQPDAAPEQSLAAAQAALAGCRPGGGLLILTDVLGATPCNVATRLLASLPDARLLTGASLPMLLRALTYRGEPLEMMAERALAGGVQGIRNVTASAS